MADPAVVDRFPGYGAAVSGTPRLLVVVNRAAGSAGDDAVSAAVRTLRTGADVEVVATGSAAELDAAVAGRDGRRLVVLGGDGSVHAVARALDRAGALGPGDPVGIVARGTGNDLARTLGLPLEPEEGRPPSSPGRPGRWTCSMTRPAAWWSTRCTPGWGRGPAPGPTG